MRVIWFFLLLSVSLRLLGGNPGIKTAVNKNKVAIGELFQLSYTINGNIDKFNQPNLQEFNIIQGPNRSFQSSFLNGNISMTTTFSYVLSAKKPGIYQIDGAFGIIGKTKTDANPVKIEVTNSSLPNGSGSPQQNYGRNGAPAQPLNKGQNKNGSTASDISAKDLENNLFLKVVPSRYKLYVGENLTATVKLYSRFDCNTREKVILEADGFWKEDLKVTGKQYDESVDGIKYMVLDLGKFSLTPQRSGKLTLNPVELNVGVRMRNPNPTAMEQFFGIASYRDYQLKLSSPKVQIEALSLPPGAPAGFKGAVGDFKLLASVDRKQVKTDESINYKIKLSGSGNIKFTDPLPPVFPEELETYDPKTYSNYSASTLGFTGNKTLEYLLIPRKPGKHIIPSTEFSFFNPTTGKYQSIKTEAIEIISEGESKSASSAVIHSSGNSPTEQVQAPLINRNLNQITLTIPSFLSSFRFWAGLLLTLVILILLFLVVKNKKRVAKPEKSQPVVAKTNAREALQKIEKLQSHSNSSILLSELDKVLQDYLKTKLAIGTNDLNREKITQQLIFKGLNASQVNEIHEILESLSMARYTPLNSEEDFINFLSKGKALIMLIETAVK